MGLIIGKYAMIGLGSVVTKNIPPFCLIFGNLAKIKGFVCYCGGKLKNIIDKKEEDIIYKYECGKIIKIKKELIYDI